MTLKVILLNADFAESSDSGQITGLTRPQLQTVGIQKECYFSL